MQAFSINNILMGIERKENQAISFINKLFVLT